MSDTFKHREKEYKYIAFVEDSFYKVFLKHLIDKFQTPKGNVITEELMKFSNERLEK